MYSILATLSSLVSLWIERCCILVECGVNYSGCVDRMFVFMLTDGKGSKWVVG